MVRVRGRRHDRLFVLWFSLALVGLVAAGALVFTVPLMGLPIAVGVAILRYRLYDIDLLVNRTLVYGSLTALLGATYLGGVVLMQGAFRALTGQESQLAIVASTLLIAALFVPLRRRVQSFIDRRFYRRRYDAARTLQNFSTRLREKTDLDSLDSELLGVVRETVQPAHVSLWLRPRGAGVETGRRGEFGEHPSPLPARLVAVGRGDRAGRRRVASRHGGSSVAYVRILVRGYPDQARPSRPWGP
jgi:hypothetical protein